ncbi:MAG: LysR substrate-binding domain-containing protein [Bacteroidota bacterium]
MTLTQLEYIVAVDTHRSFAEAASSCGVTQPTLSMQIKKLEEELEILVFDRTKKPVLTTDMGKEIVVQARKTLSEASHIQQLISERKGEVRGELKLGIIPTLSPYLLPLFMLSFLEKYPQVNIVVEELVSEEIIERLHQDQLDVGLLVTPLKRKALIETPLFYELFVVYVSSNHPLNSRVKLDFRELNLEEMWLLKEGHCFRNQVINICGEQAHSGNERLRFESGSLETLRRIVDQQYGYTLLPELATLDMGQEQYKNIKHFKNPQPVREVSLVRHRNFFKAHLIQLLESEIKAGVPDILHNPQRGKLIDWELE